MTTISVKRLQIERGINKGENDRQKREANAPNNKQPRKEYKKEKILETVRIDDDTLLTLAAPARRNHHTRTRIEKS